MSIQLLRVEAEYFRPGDEIHGPGNIILYTQNIPVGAGTGIWVARSPDMKESVIVTPDQISFKNESCFLRLKAIGLESEGIHSGDLDFNLYIKPAVEVLGDALWEIVSLGDTTTFLKKKNREVTFVAVIDMQGEVCKLLGILPLDMSLMCAILHVGIAK